MSATRITGYLSMHRTGLDDDSGLELKWAPNRAMSVPQEGEEQQQQRSQRPHSSPRSYSNAVDASKLMLHESCVAVQYQFYTFYLRNIKSDYMELARGM